MKTRGLFVLGVLGAVVMGAILVPNYFLEKNNSVRVIPAQFREQDLFLTPIRHATGTSLVQTTGVIVPHHLLARDLIANTFSRIATSSLKHIILLSPDHFSLGKKSISVSRANFGSVFGVIKNDTYVSEALLALPIVSEENFFYREHGIGAIFPFIKYYMSDVPMIAITIKEGALRGDVDALVEFLKKNILPDTLVIQSTDFSHYLTKAIADTYDSESLAVIKKNDSSGTWKLNEPSNLDSKESLYVNVRLQSELFDTHFVLFQNKNSQDYIPEFVQETTSYITGAFVR